MLQVFVTQPLCNELAQERTILELRTAGGLQ